MSSHRESDIDHPSISILTHAELNSYQYWKGELPYPVQTKMAAGLFGQLQETTQNWNVQSEDEHEVKKFLKLLSILKRKMILIEFQHL